MTIPAALRQHSGGNSGQETRCFGGGRRWPGGEGGHQTGGGPRQGGGATRLIEATMLKGNVSHFEATWEVTPFDPQRSLVAFQIFVDPQMPVPESLVNHENQKNARKAVRALRELMAQRKVRAKA